MEGQLYCRLCLEGEHLHNLDDSVINCIKNKFSIEIRDDDNLSKEICAECHKYITGLIEFDGKIVEKEKLLQKIVQREDSHDLSINATFRTSANTVVHEAPLFEIFCPSTPRKTDKTMDTNAVLKCGDELISEVIKSINLDEVEKTAEREKLKQISKPNDNFCRERKIKIARFTKCKKYNESIGHRLKLNTVKKCGDPDIISTHTLGYRCEFCQNTFTNKTVMVFHRRREHRQSINRRHLKRVLVPKNNKKNIGVKKNEKNRLPEVEIENEPGTVNVNVNLINYEKYPCRYCSDKSFGLMKSLRRHIKKNHKEVYLCWHCNFTTKINRSLKDHIRKAFELTHSQRVCSTCFKFFDSQTDVLSHRKVDHITKISPICSVCNMSFTNSVLLKKHQRNLHRRSSRRFENTARRRQHLKSNSCAKSARSNSASAKSKTSRVPELTKKIDTPLKNRDEKIQAYSSPLIKLHRIDSALNEINMDSVEHSAVEQIKTVPEELAHRISKSDSVKHFSATSSVTKLDKRRESCTKSVIKIADQSTSEKQTKIVDKRNKSELNATVEKISRKQKRKTSETEGNLKTLTEQHTVVQKMKTVREDLARRSTFDSAKHFNALSSIAELDKREKSYTTTLTKITHHSSSEKLTKMVEKRNKSELNSRDRGISGKQKIKSSETEADLKTPTEQRSIVEKIDTVPEKLSSRSTFNSVNNSNPVTELDKRRESCATTSNKIAEQSTNKKQTKIVEKRNKSELILTDEKFSYKQKRKFSEAEGNLKTPNEQHPVAKKMKTVEEELARRSASDSVKHFNPLSSVTESDKCRKSRATASTKIVDHSTNKKRTKIVEKRSKSELNSIDENISGKQKRKSTKTEENPKTSTEHTSIVDSKKDKMISCKKCGLLFKHAIFLSQHESSVHTTSASTYDYATHFRALKWIQTLPLTVERNKQMLKKNYRIVDRSVEIPRPTNCSTTLSSQSAKIDEPSEGMPEQVANYSNYPSLSQKKDDLSCNIQRSSIYPSKLASSLKEINDSVDRSAKTQESEDLDKTSSPPKKNDHSTDRSAEFQESANHLSKPYSIPRKDYHTDNRPENILAPIIHHSPNQSSTPKKNNHSTDRSAEIQDQEPKKSDHIVFQSPEIIQNPVDHSIPSPPASLKLQNHQFGENSLNPNASPLSPVTETRRGGIIVNRPAVNYTSSSDLRLNSANDSKIKDFRMRNKRLHVDTTTSDENHSSFESTRHRNENVQDETFERSPYWYKVTLYYRGTNDRYYIISKLKNYVRPVIFTPLGTQLENGNVVFFVDNESASKAIRRANLKLRQTDGSLVEIKVEYKMPIVRITTTLKEKIARVIASKYDDNAQHLNLSKFYLNEDFIKQDLLVLLNRPNVALAVFQSIDKNIPKLKSLDLSNNSIYSTQYFSLLKNHAKELKSIDLSKNQIKTLNHLRCLEGLKLDSLVLNCNPLWYWSRDKQNYVRGVRRIFPTLLVLDKTYFRLPDWYVDESSDNGYDDITSTTDQLTPISSSSIYCHSCKQKTEYHAYCNRCNRCFRKDYRQYTIHLKEHASFD